LGPICQRRILGLQEEPTVTIARATLEGIAYHQVYDLANQWKLILRKGKELKVGGAAANNNDAISIRFVRI
jgi:glycerol kinase